MRRGEVEGTEGLYRRSSEIGAKTDIAMTISVAEGTNTSSAGDNRVCSSRRGRNDECSSGKGVRTGNGGFSKKELLCYGSGSW